MSKNNFCFDYPFENIPTQSKQEDTQADNNRQIDEKIAKFVLPILVDAAAEYNKFGEEFQEEYSIPASYRIKQIEKFLEKCQNNYISIYLINHPKTTTGTTVYPMEIFGPKKT